MAITRKVRTEWDQFLRVGHMHVLDFSLEILIQCTSVICDLLALIACRNCLGGGSSFEQTNTVAAVQQSVDCD